MGLYKQVLRTWHCLSEHTFMSPRFALQRNGHPLCGAIVDSAVRFCLSVCSMYSHPAILVALGFVTGSALHLCGHLLLWLAQVCSGRVYG
jgi:hypothetical protein